jgi:methylthioribose-1-phosphate isomerase
LATAGTGTALGVIQVAIEQGKKLHILVPETRPYLQGARLTAWELHRSNIPLTLITDNMVGHFLKTGNVNAVVTGADRIAANGDTANKIGTYQIAVLAREHNVPFYIAAPVSTFDLSIASGEQIPIEERSRRRPPAPMSHRSGRSCGAPRVRCHTASLHCGHLHRTRRRARALHRITQGSCLSGTFLFCCLNGPHSQASFSSR